MDVLIIGGGIIGCSVAFELAARHRIKAVVLERAVPGAEASSAAAGILGAQIESHAEPHDQGALFQLLLASRRRHEELDRQLRELAGIGTGFRRCGVLEVIEEGTDVDSVVRRYLWQRGHGVRVEVLDSREVRLLEPELSARVVGGIDLEEDGQIEPPLMLRALQQACALLGVSFRSGVTVRGVSSEAGRVRGVETTEGLLPASTVIVAAGSWSSQIAGLPKGISPVRPVRGQIVQCETRPPVVRRVVVGARGYVLARPDGRTLLGSTMEEVGHVKEVTVGGVHQILAHALSLLPSLARAPITATWSGFRPGTPDDKPILGKTEVEGLVMATGHHRNGILLGPETGRLIADLVATGRCDRDLSPFSPVR